MEILKKNIIRKWNQSYGKPVRSESLKVWRINLKQYIIDLLSLIYSKLAVFNLLIHCSTTVCGNVMNSNRNGVQYVKEQNIPMDFKVMMGVISLYSFLIWKSVCRWKNVGTYLSCVFLNSSQFNFIYAYMFYNLLALVCLYWNN